MKDTWNYCNHHGEFINDRKVKDLAPGKAVYARRLRPARHSHRNSGFLFRSASEYVESYGGASLNCHLLSVKFQPTGEAHTDLYGKKAVCSLIVEMETG